MESTVVQQFKTEVVLERAGFIRRACSCLLDTVFVIIILFGYEMFIQTLADWYWQGVIPKFLDIMGYAILPSYFAFWYTAKGTTPGKKILGMKLLTKDGERPGPKAVFVRVLLSYLSAWTLCFGHWFILFHPQKQSLHDMVANTYVVKMGD